MSALTALESDMAGCSVFLVRGDSCLQAQPLEVLLQTPFVHLNKAPLLKAHDADQDRLTQGLDFGDIFGDVLLQ